MLMLLKLKSFRLAASALLSLLLAALHSLCRGGASPLSTLYSATIKFYFMFMAPVVRWLFLSQLLPVGKKSVAISVSWLLNICWNSSRRAQNLIYK